MTSRPPTLLEVGFLIGGKRFCTVKRAIECKITNALGHGGSHNLLTDTEPCARVSVCARLHECGTQLH